MKLKDEQQQTVATGDHTSEIAEVAYRYWESRGREDGHDMEDWLMAEQEVMRRHRMKSATERPRHAA